MLESILYAAEQRAAFTNCLPRLEDCKLMLVQQLK